jgi:hypothetical protein
MKYKNIREEEIKNRVATDFFGKFDCDKIVGFIDFTVKLKRSKDTVNFDGEYLLWAEAKNGNHDIYAMFTQLVLTIGKARTFDKILPPMFLGCFDGEKIAFVPYSEIQDVFYQNDFNWNVTPSKHETKEFKQIYEQVEKIIETDSTFETYLFNFETDEKELHRFIRENFIVGKSGATKIKIDKNNFIIIYNKWLETVKPTISVNWEAAKRNEIIDGDFYLADLLSVENQTMKEKLFVILKSNFYEIDRKLEESGMFSSKRADFTDNQKAHNAFWAKYERPPKEDYWDYIIARRDIIVPQDVRERKGSFFTPKIWVEKSQEYLAKTFGEDWQDEYYIWDCATGTGNLLAGLTNKYKIWASTLDKQDVAVMRERIANGANLLEDHVFQFDFLNDDFTKLPQGLQNIIHDEKKRRNLIIYINPPYAEVSSVGKKEKAGVNKSKTRDAYMRLLGTASREIFAQFLIRIYKELDGCKIGEFSKLKALTGSEFYDFRNIFNADIKKCFIVPSNTFDNVPSKFPIGFKIWDTSQKQLFRQIKADIFNKDNEFIEKKTFVPTDKKQFINKWISLYKNNNPDNIGFLAGTNGNDFQQNRIVYILNEKKQMANPRGIWININNLIQTSIYFTIRKVIKSTWLNDRDQFLYPNNKWEKDLEFQNDCLAYTLFNNNISSKNGVNHWIPFHENEVNARTEFDSHFMISFLGGKIIKNGYTDLFDHDYLLDMEKKKLPKINWKKGDKRQFSIAAQTVFDAGRELWKYYHSQPNINVNASYNDIRGYFKGFGTDKKGKKRMNNKSSDEQFNILEKNLSKALNILAKKIEPKVYQYGFLKK